MEQARVGIVENDGGFVYLLETLLKNEGHAVPLTAASVLEAKIQAEKRVRRYGELALDALCLDGNLMGGIDNRDGSQVALHYKQLPGGSRLYVISMSTTEELFNGADKVLPKKAHVIVAGINDIVPQTTHGRL